MHPVKLLERAATSAVSTAVHAVRHPIATTSYAVGVARGLAGAAVHGVTVKGHDPGQGQGQGEPTLPTQRTASPEETKAAGPREPQRVPKPVPPPDAEFDPIVIEPVDDEPGESFATEPKAVSRESAHGGTAATDAEIDAWIDEAMARGDEVDIETPVGTTGVAPGYNPDTAEADLQQPGTDLLLDPSTIKSVMSESETLRKAAERDPE